MKGIAGTGFLVAFLMEDDEFQTWAREIAVTITEPLLTCDAVIAATAFKLGSVAHTLDAIEDGLVTLRFNLGSEWTAIRELGMRYADQQRDLADLCLVRMSEQFPTLPILTVDHDFEIYRRNRNQRISLITPPGF